ncbi:hypothetical protein JCM11641_001763 [Rhodosporidiobolus odoratus]
MQQLGQPHGGASTSLLTIVRAQIVFLLSTLSEDNYNKNRDEIRSLVDLHGPAPQQHLIRRLIQGAAPLLSNSPGSPPPQSQAPSPELHLRLLASETIRCARDPTLSERFRDAVLEGADGPSGADAVLRLFSLTSLLSHPSLSDLSALERLVFLAPFLTLLYPSTVSHPAPTGLKRSLGLEAVHLLRSSLHRANEQLATPSAQNSHDLPELSPLPIARLFSILLSDINLSLSPTPDADGDPALSEEDRRAFVVSCVRGRLGGEFGAQALAHAFNEVAFDERRPPSFVQALMRMAPVALLCSVDLARSVWARFGGISTGGGAGAEGGEGGTELKVAQQMFDLLAFAQREGDQGRGSFEAVMNSWVRTVHDALPSLRWGDVLRAFDSPLRPVPESWGMRALAAMLAASPAPIEDIPEDRSARSPLTSSEGGTSAISGLWGAWGNPMTQFLLLDKLINLSTPPTSSSSSHSDPAPVNLSALPSTHRLVATSDAASAGPTIKNLAAQVQSSPWNAREVVQTLVRLNGEASVGGNGELAARVHACFDKGSKAVPELLLIGLVTCDKPWSSFQTEITARLLSTFLAGHPSHQLVFLRLLQIDRAFLLAALSDYYTEDETNVTRILDVAQDLKALDDVLSLRPYALTLDLAALASQREYLNLQKWLGGQIRENGSEMVRAALEFVGHKVQAEWEQLKTKEIHTLVVPPPTISAFLRVLRVHHEYFSENDVELFKEVRTQALILHPRLMNFMPGQSNAEPAPNLIEYSKKVNSECDALFHRMYGEQMTVEAITSVLKALRESENPTDQEFFACTVSGLFHEYRFFTTYPPNELALTAAFFGDIIQHQLVDTVPLGIGVRYVLDALRQPPDSAYFSFGLDALERFKSRLGEWPQFAQAIVAIPHVQQLRPELANTARQALMQRDGDGGGNDFEGATLGNGGGGELVQAAQQQAENLAFTSIHVEDAGGDPEAPDEATSDKILFIVNNLAPLNFDTKVIEMSNRIEPMHFAWFAHYLVAQRVSIEPNNHQLYQQFLDALKMPHLVKRVLYETFVKLATLLNSDKTVQSSTERTLLKNLGSWLGGLTLAKDKPIKQTNIAFKQLLIEGYDSNRLIVAIPFVCKVLEQCAKSRVFRPPNPWLMAILRLLVELYQFAELKLNLKFEIEVLCKSLDVDLKDVEPTEILRNRPQELAAQAAAAAAQAAHVAAQQAQVQAAAAIQAAAQQQQNHPTSGGGTELTLAALAAHQRLQRDDDLRAAGLAISAAHHALPAAGGDARLPPMLGQNQPGYSLGLQETVAAALQNLPSQVVFSSQVPLFSSNANLKRLICVAIDHAIREIIAPVVERSVTIAGISTRELAMKDFAMEGDESKMAGAAHLMVQNLAGSLAQVTCKEPLRLSMISHARTLLLQNGFDEETLPEQGILVVVAENLDLASSVIEKVAMDKAVQEVDEGLGPAYVSRRSHRERSREAFWDTAAMAASHYSGMLPDPLRLKLGGLSASQLQVYEDFARIRTLPPAVDSRNGGAYGESPAVSAALVPTPAPAAAIEPIVLTLQQAMEKFTSLIAELDAAFAAEDATTLAAVGQDSDVRRIVHEIPAIVESCSAKDEVTMACSQKVVQLLYRSDSTLAHDAFIQLTERLCAISAKVAKEVISWLVMAEDERKFNVPVTIALVHARFITIGELDLHLAKWALREYRAPVLDFVAKVVSACLAEVPPVATDKQFSNSVHALKQAVQKNKATDAARQLLQEVQSRATATVKPSVLDEPGVREQLTACFAEWVRLYQQSLSVEKSFVDFVVQLQKQGILKGEDISSLFFRVCAEVSVDSYIKNKAAGGTAATGIFTPVDAFAKLITFMIKYHADPAGTNNDKAKVHYMTKVVAIVVLVLASSHEELGPHFQQKPFFRFFSSLMSNIAALESHLGAGYYQILVALSHSLNTLQPMFFPGFAFSWVALISHRLFMPKLLEMPDREGWTSLLRQLIALFRFLSPFLRRTTLTETTRTLYIGAQRILLVLLHDTPEFLASAAYALCDAIPPQCVQLHNLILSAFPVNSQLRLPDPLSPGLRLESLVESQKSPSFITDFSAALSAAELRAPIDQFLSSGKPSDILELIKARIVLAPSPSRSTQDGEKRYNLALINSLVLYLGVNAINKSKAQIARVDFLKDAEATKLLRSCIEVVEPEPRYRLLSACVSHLRYPSSHTMWFAAFLLDLFGSTEKEEVRETILTVLLSRVMASRPQPFGALFMFTQLLRTQHDKVVGVFDRLPAEVRGVQPFTSFISDLAARISGAQQQQQQQQQHAQAIEAV